MDPPLFICVLPYDSEKMLGLTSVSILYRDFGTLCAVDYKASPAFHQPLTVFVRTPTVTDDAVSLSYDCKVRVALIFLGVYK